MICLDNIDIGTELFYIKKMLNHNIPTTFIDENDVEWSRKNPVYMYIIFKGVISGKEVTKYIGECGSYGNYVDIMYFLKYDDKIIDINHITVDYLFYTAEDAENAVKHLVDHGKLPEVKI